MNDNLRTSGFFPLTEPFTNLGITMPAGAGGEQIDSGVLITTGNDAIVDWVWVELRDAANSAQILGASAALLQRDGDVVDTDGSTAVKFPGLPSGDYFLTIRHRNHLPIMSADSVYLDLENGINYDFTIANSYAEVFSFGQKEIQPNIWVMYAGNGDQFENADVVDINGKDKAFYSQFNGNSGIYHNADYNLDADVNGQDKTILSPNFGIFSIVPVGQ